MLRLKLTTATLAVPFVVVLLVLGPALTADVDVRYYGTGDAIALRVCMNNTTDEAAEHRVWTGEVHPCVRHGYQPLVVGQDVVWRLGPGESREATVPAYCGNSRLAAPPPNMLYLPARRVDQRLRTIILENGLTHGPEQYATQRRHST